MVATLGSHYCVWRKFIYCTIEHYCQNHNSQFFDTSNFILHFAQLSLNCCSQLRVKVSRKTVFLQGVLSSIFLHRIVGLYFIFILHMVGFLLSTQVLSCIGTVDCTIFKSCSFIETAKTLIMYWKFDANPETYTNCSLFKGCKTIQPRTFHCNSIFWKPKNLHGTKQRIQYLEHTVWTINDVLVDP